MKLFRIIDKTHKLYHVPFTYDNSISENTIRFNSGSVLYQLEQIPELENGLIVEEKILCSAINYNGAIITGRRHSDCYKSLKSILEVESYSNINFDLSDREHQGFLTTFNRFVDRKEAYKIAKAQNQIRYGFDATENGEESILISENLFNPEIE